MCGADQPRIQPGQTPVAAHRRVSAFRTKSLPPVLTPTRLRTPLADPDLLPCLTRVCGRRTAGITSSPRPGRMRQGRDQILPLLHLGSLDSFDITDGGTKAAIQILECVENGDIEGAKETHGIFHRILRENFGGEYTALEWLCEYLIAPPQEQERCWPNAYVASFYHVLAENQYTALESISAAQVPSRPGGRQGERRGRPSLSLPRGLLCSSTTPARERWEKSSRIIEAIGFKSGDVVADVGCGPGYYTFKLARLVGDGGRVYAIDNNERHLIYLRLAEKLRIRNVRSSSLWLGTRICPRMLDSTMCSCAQCTLFLRRGLRGGA